MFAITVSSRDLPPQKLLSNLRPPWSSALERRCALVGKRVWNNKDEATDRCRNPGIDSQAAGNRKCSLARLILWPLWLVRPTEQALVVDGDGLKKTISHSSLSWASARARART